jgi:membrane-associated protein
MIQQAIDFILHLNVHLATVISQFGYWTYLILFLIIFAETGLVITPFLPGDSLLFTAGSLSAVTALNVHALALLLLIAAFVGNFVNYLIGRWFGHLLFDNPHSKIFKQKYLNQAHTFYQKYGASAVVISRFLPLVRTFVPFVAGMAKMTYKKFMLYNFLGAVLWVGLLTYVGYFFGQLPMVKKNFSWVIVGIIIFSLAPVAFEVTRQFLKKEK